MLCDNTLGFVMHLLNRLNDGIDWMFDCMMFILCVGHEHLLKSDSADP